MVFNIKKRRKRKEKIRIKILRREFKKLEETRKKFYKERRRILQKKR